VREREAHPPHPSMVHTYIWSMGTHYIRHKDIHAHSRGRVLLPEASQRHLFPCMT
jgi:hypothetical protein